jgi:predicted phosphodiesterase
MATDGRVMRLGIVSDIHGNRAGFEACVADMGTVDQLVFTGDLLGYYFEGPAILRRLRELDAICLAGNHDLYFLAHLGRTLDHPIAVPPAAEYRRRYGPSLALAAEELSAEEVEWLASQPCLRDLECEGRRIKLVHGSPWRPADEYIYPNYAAFDRFDELGHPHRPLIRSVGTTTLLNTGSSGQPRDGDLRASYAIVDVTAAGVACEIRRVAYDQRPLIEACHRLAPDAPLPLELLLPRT